MFVLYFVSFFLISGCNCVKSEIENKWKSLEVSEEVAYQQLLKLEKTTKENIAKMIKQALPMMMNSNSSVELSGACMGSLLKAIGALQKLKMWPILMLDAMGKPPGGLFRGSISAYGSYDECVNIVIPSSRKKSKPQVGQYCIVEFSSPLPPKPKRIKLDMNVFPNINATFESELFTKIKDSMFAAYQGSFQFGLCIPSSCTKDDLKKMINAAMKDSIAKAIVGSCEIKEPLNLDSLQIGILTLLLVIILLNIASTLYCELNILRSYTTKEKPYQGKWISVAEIFFIRKNFLSLMKTRKPRKKSFDALNGMRFISTIWVVICHCYVFNTPTLSRDVLNIRNMVEDFFFQPLLNGFLAVFAFMIISSTLMSYNIVKYTSANGNFSPVKVFVRRLWRLWPILMLVYLLSLTLPLFGSGPVFNSLYVPAVDKCKTQWWRIALFISNFFPMDESCIGYTWYLCVDIQCLFFGLAYYLIYFKNQYAGNLLLVLGVITASTYSGLITYIKDYPPAFVFQFGDVGFTIDILNENYMKPYVYLGVYSMGLFLGTYLAKTPNVKISKLSTSLGWIASIVVGVTVVYAVYPWNKGESYTMLEAIAYSSLHRLAFGLCIAWVIFACYTGNGGFINNLLSWPGFQPLAKLSFLVYMTHLPIYLFYNFTLIGPEDATHKNLVFKFFGCVCISHMVAVFMSVLVEIPLINMDRLFFKWMTDRSRSKISIERSDTIIQIDKDRPKIEMKLTNSQLINGSDFKEHNGQLADDIKLGEKDVLPESQN